MSHSSGDPRKKVVPAQLGFLAIYNPSLGTTDETLNDQIVYYSSTETRKSKRRPGKDGSEKSKDEENERLRQVGLAQGMVEFAKTFSEGKSVDAIETEKSRIILHELEAGWWILASIDLTRLPKVQKSTDTNNKAAEEEGSVEYSSREVKPSPLLLQDLLRAHSIFLLHNASSISDLFIRNRRSKFINTLGRYWDEFLSTWNVMLHGNPAVAVYGGIKLAGSGELGMGVGEEDRGSGEREVLEGFVGRIEGLVDLVVSRFGDTATNTDGQRGTNLRNPQSQLLPSEPWLGTGLEPGLDDGAIFLGVGALSRKSLRDVTHWMEDLYSWGPRAYGVMNKPTSTRRKHGKRRQPAKTADSDATITQATQRAHAEPRSSKISAKPAKPKGRKDTLDSSQKQGESSLRGVLENEPSMGVPETSATSEMISDENKRRPSFRRTPSSTSSTHSNKAGTFIDYFKLGYGRHWSLGGGMAKSKEETTPRDTGPLTSTPTEEVSPKEDAAQDSDHGNSPSGFDNPFYPVDDSIGHYLVGLLGDVEAEEPEGSGSDDSEADSTSPRILLRTVTVELERERDARAKADISIDLSTTDEVLPETQVGSQNTSTSNVLLSKSQDGSTTTNLRIVAYVNKPFIFTLIFELETEASTLPSLYRSLHHQLAPLQRPLLASTSHKLSRPDISTAAAGDAKTPIYDIIWDPKRLTISSTIPDIPSPSPYPCIDPAKWSRLEALNTHIQLLNTFSATRNENSELERTCKTSRGYWVVWTRIPDPEVAQNSKPKSQGTITPINESITTSEAASPLSSLHISNQSPGQGRADTNRCPSQASSAANRSSMSHHPAHPFLDTAAIAMNGLTKDKEIFLIRKASDAISTSAFARGRENANAPAKLAQGIGVDTKRYIEELLDMY